jgi:hypothetical protein
MLTIDSPKLESGTFLAKVTYDEASIDIAQNSLGFVDQY